MAKILVVEDDLMLAENIKNWLELEQHVVELIADGQEAFDHLKVYDFELVILDWALPGLSGVEVCTKFRLRGGKTPVLMLTGKQSITDKETGLDSGADDYLTKPFHMKELSARVRALLRRPPIGGVQTLTRGDIKIDLLQHKVTKGDSEINLLPKEFALLEFLMRHPNQVFTPEALVDRVWASTSDVSPESVRTYVTRIRKKLDSPDHASIIENVYGIGYKLVSERS